MEATHLTQAVQDFCAKNNKATEGATRWMLIFHVIVVLVCGVLYALFLNEKKKRRVLEEKLSQGTLIEISKKQADVREVFAESLKNGGHRFAIRICNDTGEDCDEMEFIH
jgi:hypothetical protein